MPETECFGYVTVCVVVTVEVVIQNTSVARAGALTGPVHRVM